MSSCSSSVLSKFRIGHHKNQHRYGVQRDYLPLVKKDSLNGFVDNKPTEKDGDRQISDDFKHDMYVTLFNYEVYHDCSDAFGLCLFARLSCGRLQGRIDGSQSA